MQGFSKHQGRKYLSKYVTKQYLSKLFSWDTRVMIRMALVIISTAETIMFGS